MLGVSNFCVCKVVRRLHLSIDTLKPIGHAKIQCAIQLTLFKQICRSFGKFEVLFGACQTFNQLCPLYLGFSTAQTSPMVREWVVTRNYHCGCWCQQKAGLDDASVFIFTPHTRHRPGVQHRGLPVCAQQCQLRW